MKRRLENAGGKAEVAKKLKVEGKPLKKKDAPLKKPKSAAPTGSPDDVFFPQNSQEIMTWLLSAKHAPTFFDQHWEKKPLHVKRNDSGFYRSLFSLAQLEKLFRSQELFFGEHLNAVKFEDGRKEVYNGEGVASADEVLKLFHEQKCTLQFHQPQQFCDGLRALCSTLEDYFGCLVGSNAYLTPTGAQGLAPHHDDVDVFILQTEGSKRWKLYSPLEELAEEYSPDLPEEEIGEPMMEVELQQGDLLYFPRGTIHCASTNEDEHSTHITLSTYQKNSWGALLRHALNMAIENAMADNVELRRGLPIRFGDQLGSFAALQEQAQEETQDTKSDKKKKQKKQVQKVVAGGKSAFDAAKREEYMSKLAELFSELTNHLDFDSAADYMLEDFVQSRLPPFQPKQKAPVTDRAPAGPPPETDNLLVRLRYPSHCRMTVMGGAQMSQVILAHSLSNDPTTHMTSPPEDDEEGGCCGDGGCCDEGECCPSDEHSHEDEEEEEKEEEEEEDEEDEEEEDEEEVETEGSQIRLPAAFAPALASLFATSPNWVPISSLPETGVFKIQALMFTLWMNGLLEVKKP